MENILYCRSNKLEIIRLKNKPFNYTEHNHVSVYTIGLVLDGEIMLKCDGCYKHYFPNSFFIVAPYQVHALLLPKTYDLLTICINKNLLDTSVASELLGMISELLSQLSQEFDYNLLSNALNAMYLRKISPSFNADFLSSALNEKSHDLKDMADEASYSLYHYIKVFKQEVGITPHKFKTQSRIRKAQRMIESKRIFMDVALELGFYDQSHFIKSFKSIVGLTPSEYSKVLKKIG